MDLPIDRTLGRRIVSLATPVVVAMMSQTAHQPGRSHPDRPAPRVGVDPRPGRARPLAHPVLDGRRLALGHLRRHASAHRAAFRRERPRTRRPGALQLARRRRRHLGRRVGAGLDWRRPTSCTSSPRTPTSCASARPICSGAWPASSRWSSPSATRAGSTGSADARAHGRGHLDERDQLLPQRRLIFGKWGFPAWGVTGSGDRVDDQLLHRPGADDRVEPARRATEGVRRLSRAQPLDEAAVGAGQALGAVGVGDDVRDVGLRPVLQDRRHPRSRLRITARSSPPPRRTSSSS